MPPAYSVGWKMAEGKAAAKWATCCPVPLAISSTMLVLLLLLLLLLTVVLMAVLKGACEARAWAMASLLRSALGEGFIAIGSASTTHVGRTRSTRRRRRWESVVKESLPSVHSALRFSGCNGRRTLGSGEGMRVCS